MERISPLPPREDLQVVIKSASVLSLNNLSVYSIKSSLLASIPSIESQKSKPTIDTAKNNVPKANIRGIHISVAHSTIIMLKETYQSE